MAVTPELEKQMAEDRLVQLKAQHPDGDHDELRAIGWPTKPSVDKPEKAQPVGKIGGKPAE
jgi:hypothetical protein